MNYPDTKFDEFDQIICPACGIATNKNLIASLENLPCWYCGRIIPPLRSISKPNEDPFLIPTEFHPENLDSGIEESDLGCLHLDTYEVYTTSDLGPYGLKCRNCNYVIPLERD